MPNVVNMRKFKNMASFTGMLFFLIAFMVNAGCNVIDIHPYDCNIKGEKDINSKNIEKIESLLNGKEEFTFAFISDTQRWYDETAIAVDDINSRGVDFVVHGGDLSDFGITKEFLWQRDILMGLKAPWVALIGNHDCLGSGEQAYEAIFGKQNFSFVAADVLFVCLNTNAMEFNYATPVPDFGYLGRLLKNLPENVSRTVFVMHARPFAYGFNNNVAHVFDHYTRSFPNVQFLLFGHEHKMMEQDLFGTGKIYYGVSNIDQRKYYIFKVNKVGYTYEVVEF